MFNAVYCGISNQFPTMQKYLYLLSFCLLIAAGKASGQVTNTGNDAFGYTFATNLAATNPAVYEWIDISTTGTKLTGLGDDNVVGPVSLGINFKYYWNTYNEVFVGSNGYIMFGDNQLIAQGSGGIPTIPSNDGRSNFIAPFMADLIFKSSGTGVELSRAKVFYQTIGDKFVITYDSVPFWNNAPAGGIDEATGSNTFQVILDGATNNIHINYKECVGPWFTGNTGVLSCGMENITGALSLRWRRKGPNNVTLPPASSAVTVTYPASSSYIFKDVSAKAVFYSDNKGRSMFTNTPDTLQVYLQNSGTVKVTTPTTARIFVFDETGTDVYNSLVTIDSLAQGETRIIRFPTPFNPGASPASFKVQFNAATTGDQFSGNNQKLTKLVVLDSTAGDFDLRFTTVNVGTADFNQIINSGMIFDAPYQPMIITKISVDLVWPDADAWAGLNIPSVNDSLTPTTVKMYLANGPNGSPGFLLDSFVIASPTDYPYEVVGTEVVGGADANFLYRFKRTLPTPYYWFSNHRIYVGVIHNRTTNFVWNAPFGEVYAPGIPASGRSLEITGGTWGENRGKDSIDVGVGIVGDPLAVAITPVVKINPIVVDQNIPNPATSTTSIGMFLPKQGRVKVTLRDVTGREVYSQEYFKPAGRQKVDLSLEGIRPQLYFYTVEHESGSVTKRLIVK